MFASQARALGVLAGYLADVALGDPKRGHPVALFGQAATKLEQFSYRDTHGAGVLHVGLLVGGVSALGSSLQHSVGCRWPFLATATATWVCLGGTSLARTGLAMSDLLDDGDVEAA